MSGSSQRATTADTAEFAVVTQELVHKTASEEVLLTAWHRRDDDEFVVRARWPERHSFYTTSGGCHDPLLAAESVRQAVPLLSHAAYGAPAGHRQIWEHFTCTLHPEALAATEGPAELELHITCSGISRRGNRLAAMTMHVRLTRLGHCLGSAQARISNQPPAIYRRLRGRYADLDAAVARAIPLVPPAPPGQVRRTRFDDVVLSPTNDPQRYQLRVDTAHPILFDHSVDHVPGMLLLEAARQATHAAAGPQDAVLTGMDCIFLRYAELDAPCWIETAAVTNARLGRSTVHVAAHQSGHEVFSAITTTEHTVRP